jgi:hypothetical protein
MLLTPYGSTILAIDDRLDTVAQTIHRATCVVLTKRELTLNYRSQLSGLRVMERETTVEAEAAQ